MLLILNDIAASEIVLILVFVLIFFGSKSIPGLAKTLGRAIRQVKEASSDIQSEIKKSADGMKGEMNLKGIIEETAEEVRRPLDQYAEDIGNTMKYTPPNKRKQVDLNEESIPKVEIDPSQSVQDSENEEQSVLDRPKTDITND